MVGWNFITRLTLTNAISQKAVPLRTMDVVARNPGILRGS